MTIARFTIDTGIGIIDMHMYIVHNMMSTYESETYVCMITSYVKVQLMCFGWNMNILHKPFIRISI